MVDFRGVANKLSLQVMDCLKTSEPNPNKSANIDPLTADQPKKSNDYVNNASGLRWIEDVVLGKRNDRSFRMVIVGDPNLHLHEIGIPCHIAERLQDSESLTAWNWEKLSACFENDVFLSSFELQQLHMFHPVRFLLPAVKSPSANACVWIGKQLISLLRPVGFDHDFPSSEVCIRNVDLVYSEGSFWLRETLMVTYFKALEDIAMVRFLIFCMRLREFLICEWLSTRGLSVSLSEFYLCPDSYSRKNMMDEILSGLLDADYTCNLKHLMVDSCRDFLTVNN